MGKVNAILEQPGTVDVLLAHDCPDGGVTATTESVASGYYLIYAPAELSVASLVFYDARGKVVDELALHPHP
jgi:hypothetical protein